MHQTANLLGLEASTGRCHGRISRLPIEILRRPDGGAHIWIDATRLLPGLWFGPDTVPCPWVGVGDPCVKIHGARSPKLPETTRHRLIRWSELGARCERGHVRCTIVGSASEWRIAAMCLDLRRLISDLDEALELVAAEPAGLQTIRPAVSRRAHQG